MTLDARELTRTVDEIHMELGKLMWNECGMARSAAGLGRALAEQLRAGAWLLGLLTQDPQTWGRSAAGDDAEIDRLVKQRDALRRERNFAEADRIRRELTERGIVIEDAAGGARWRRLR